MGVVSERANTRSGTTADWVDGPILDPGEIGINTETGEIKLGDGTTAFASLSAQGGGRVLKGVATLAGGTVTVTGLTGVTSASVVQVTTKTLGTVTVASAHRALPSTNQVVITASQPTDTSVVMYTVIV
jgi:hypothetical protein